MSIAGGGRFSRRISKNSRVIIFGVQTYHGDIFHNLRICVNALYKNNYAHIDNSRE